MWTGAERGHWPGPLSAAVAGLCGQLRPQVSRRVAAGFDQVLWRLSAPLQVAVAGRLSAGKSTLVNALIGRKVAPTAAGECTRLVTRFQYGTVDHVEVVLRDGNRKMLPFDVDGGIPATLGAELDQVSHLEAYLTNAVLRDLTVIDTPGLGSLHPTSAERAEEVLTPDPVESGVGSLAESGTEGDELDSVSRSAILGAEAVLYVMTQAVRADDQQVLASFTAATGARDAGPLNVIAVLNKADTIEPESLRDADGDLWTAARLLASRHADLLKPKVADVLPMVSLLAETAETGGFTATDADVLRQIAGLDEDTRKTLLLSGDLFTSWDCAVPAAARARLLERMDLYGVACALEALDAEPAIETGALRRALYDASGLASMRDRLDTVFRARADGIKAAAALASVTALAHSGSDAAERQRVRDAVEELLARAEAHQLRLLEALTLVASGAVELPADLAEEVMRVGSAVDVAQQLGMPGGSPQQLCDHALERASWWRSFATFGSTPGQSRVGHVVHRAYFLLWQQLRAGDGSITEE